jgi:hypothetical protein
MKFWESEYSFELSDVPAQVADLADELQVVMQGNGSYPKLLRIGKDLSDGDHYCRYQVDVEIAPGLMLQTEYGLQEALDDGSEKEEEDVERVTAAVSEGLVAALHRKNELVDAVHDARIRARRVVGTWNADGVPTRLIDVHLAPYDHWRGCPEPYLHVLVEALSDNLQPSPLMIHIDDPEQLEARMATERECVAAGYGSRARLARLGASGTVSRLAINAMGHFGDVAETLRRFDAEWRFWLRDDTALIMSRGHVSAGSGDPHAKIDWWDTHLNIPSLQVPATILTAAIGRPVATLVEHPFLTDDLVITEAVCTIEEGMPMVTIHFTNPTFLFCAKTGRWWEAADAEDDASAKTRSQIEAT